MQIRIVLSQLLLFSKNAQRGEGEDMEMMEISFTLSKIYIKPLTKKACILIVGLIWVYALCEVQSCNEWLLIELQSLLYILILAHKLIRMVIFTNKIRKSCAKSYRRTINMWNWRLKWQNPNVVLTYLLATELLYQKACNSNLPKQLYIYRNSIVYTLQIITDWLQTRFLSANFEISVISTDKH